MGNCDGSKLSNVSIKNSSFIQEQEKIPSSPIISSKQQNYNNYNIQKQKIKSPIQINNNKIHNSQSKNNMFPKISIAPMKSIYSYKQLNKISLDDPNEISFDEAKNFLYNKCNISPSILDDNGTTKIGWSKGAKRGPPGFLKDYIPPIGWTGIGLKVVNIYEDNVWIGTNNSPGEWYIGIME